MATTTQATPLKLPQAPTAYEQRDQDHTRRLIELTFNQIARSVQMASGGDAKIGAFTQITIAAVANTTAFIISGYSVTGASVLPCVDWAGSWVSPSGAGATFFKANLTVSGLNPNTNAKLVDFQFNANSTLFIDSLIIGGGGRVVVASTFEVFRYATTVSFFTVATNGAGVVTIRTPSLATTTSSFLISRAAGGNYVAWDTNGHAIFSGNITGAFVAGTRLILSNATDSDLATDIKISADDVWSGTTNTRTFCKFTLTDTLSGAGSLFADWQKDTTTVFKVTKGGQVTAVVLEGAPTATLNALILTGPTYTTNVQLATMTATWNAAGVVFTAIKLNITNTASAAGSLLLDLQVATVSQWSVDKGGVVTQAGALTISAGGATITGQVVLQTNIGIRFNNHTNGAGVAAGTLNNAPAAGDPAFWLPVSIAGTTRHIPCW